MDNDTKELLGAIFVELKKIEKILQDSYDNDLSFKHTINERITNIQKNVSSIDFKQN